MTEDIRKKKLAEATKRYRATPKGRAAALRAAKKWAQNNKAAVARRNKALVKVGRDYLLSLKTGPCMDCGVMYPSYVMDFDHVRGKKSFNLSKGGTRGKGSIDREVAKCDLVCANCHRERTHQREQ